MFPPTVRVERLPIPAVSRDDETPDGRLVGVTVPPPFRPSWRITRLTISFNISSDAI
jgi:hypothetical protein